LLEFNAPKVGALGEGAKGVEKARKENHFKKREQLSFAPFLAFLSVFALGFWFQLLTVLV
jgi:prepilin signal peptidase PulO-like enzyme (type II secretory pathway)